MKFGKRKQTTERQHEIKLEPAKLGGIQYVYGTGIVIDAYTNEDKMKIVVTRKEAARLIRDLENGIEAWDTIEEAIPSHQRVSS